MRILIVVLLGFTYFIEKSIGKKGFFYPSTDPTYGAMNAINVTWAYNLGYSRPESLQSSIPFVPMIVLNNETDVWSGANCTVNCENIFLRCNEPRFSFRLE